jgi:hypothetical protein
VEAQRTPWMRHWSNVSVSSGSGCVDVEFFAPFLRWSVTCDARDFWENVENEP